MRFKHSAHPLANEANFVTSFPNYRKQPNALPARESPSPLLGYIWGPSKLDQPVDGLISFPSATCYGGILDSPLVMHHTASNHGHHSRLPMQPMSTLALPPIDSQRRTCCVIFILMSLALLFLSPSMFFRERIPATFPSVQMSKTPPPTLLPPAIIELAFQVLPPRFPESMTDCRPHMKSQPVLVNHMYNNKCGSSCACSCNPGSLWKPPASSCHYQLQNHPIHIFWCGFLKQRFESMYLATNRRVHLTTTEAWACRA